MGSGLPRHFTLHPSRTLRALLLATCLLILLVLSYLPVAIWLRFSGGVVALALFAHVSSRDGSLHLVRSIVAFRLEQEDRITLIQRNGEHTPGKISDGGLVTPFLVLLNVRRDEHGNRNVVVMRDSMSRDAFRRLRAILRWKR